ncbi:DUF4268 domain-containing protein [Candidatus Poribacteria bacterium]|nr:DUF4268 domain-containing protein [Candidatus Poribacteria bacterium]
MKDYPNEEALRKAHRIYLDAMREFIHKCLESVPGTTPKELIMMALDCEPRNDFEVEIEINNIPHLIREYWDDCFRQKFDRHYDVRSATGRIKDGRNFWAHPGIGDVDPESTRMHLSLVAEALGEISKAKAKTAVEEIRNRLFSDEPEGHPAEAENTDLKERLAEMSDRLAVVETEKAEYKESHKAEWQRLEVEKAEYAELLDTVEKEKIEIEKQLESAQTRLNELKAENTELKERLSETENRLKVIELEGDEHVKTLTDKTELEEQYETTPIKEWRRKIWKQLCDYAAQKDTSVRFNKPGSENYLNVSRSLIDLTGFYMKVWLGTDNREITIRLYMSKQNFYILEKQRTEIEQEFCESLEWEELPQRTDSRISLRKDIIDPTDESDWQNQHEWVISKLEKFHKKFNEVFLPRIQELNTSDSLLEDEEYLPLNPATPNSVTFQGTTFVKHLDEYRVAGDDITQNFWHYWQSQGREGKQEMRNAGWSVEKIDGEWKVTVSPEDFQAWIENEVTELNSLLNSSQNEESSTQPPRLFYGKTVLPTGKEMEQPALEFLSDGREYPRIEIINVLTEHFSLTKNQREQLSRSGRVELYLRNKDLIERTRTGYYRITDLGLQVLKQNLDDVPF